MEYSTYWSIIDTPSYTIKPAAITSIVVVFAGLGFLLIKKFMAENGEGTKSMLMWSTAIFGLLGLVMTFLLTFIWPDQESAKMAAMLDTDKFKEVEGVISNFERKYRGSSRGSVQTVETFTVDSVHFAYGNAKLGGFNSFSDTENNVIFNGQNVRVTYRSGSNYGKRFNTIFKIEIGE